MIRLAAEPSLIDHRARPTVLGQDRPLCFLHIPKTGGTSLTDALARTYPADSVFSQSGNIYVDYLRDLGPRLRGRIFLAGHPGPGVAAYLQGRADLITVLRRPVEQAVSNYLHVLADPENPLHAVAMGRSFADYLRLHDHQIDNQARSLSVTLTLDPAQMDEIRLRRPDRLLALLDAMPFVGVMERAETTIEVLSRLLGMDQAPTLPWMNAAVCRGVSTRTLDRLRRDYEALREDPRLAPIFLREARVHAKAAERLNELAAATGVAPRCPARREPYGHVAARRFSTPSGRALGDTVIANLRDETAHLVHGPYDQAPVGHHAAEFHLRVEGVNDEAGRLEIEALANCRNSLGRRWLGVGDLESPRRRILYFATRGPSDVLEYRIRARGFSTGRLIFEGVTLRPSRPTRTWPSLIRQGIAALYRAFAGIGAVRLRGPGPRLSGRRPEGI